MRPDTLQLFYSLTSSHNVFEDSGYLARREKILSPTSSPRFHIAFRQFPWIFLFLASLNLYGSETNLRHVLQQTSTLQMCCVLADGLYFYHTVISLEMSSAIYVTFMRKSCCYCSTVCVMVNCKWNDNISYLFLRWTDLTSNLVHCFQKRRA